MKIDAEIEKNQSDTEKINQNIMRVEFVKAILQLKNNKAPGLAEISMELILNCGENIKKIIYVLIQKSYETG